MVGRISFLVVMLMLAPISEAVGDIHVNIRNGGDSNYSNRGAPDGRHGKDGSFGIRNGGRGENGGNGTDGGGRGGIGGSGPKGKGKDGVGGRKI